MEILKKFKDIFLTIFLIRTSNRWGVCKTPRSCPDNMLFWPKDGKCYTKLTKGPCTKGKLLVLNEDDLAECQVSKKRKLSTSSFILVLI